MKAFLNVGGNSKKIAIPPRYNGWRHDLLDIDPACKPDVLLDARKLRELPAGGYDAVYCSHNLEHYHRHDCVKVIQGFHHVLNPDGFAEIWVPDLEAVFRHVVQNNIDIDDQIYTSPAGPILVRDVLYGFHKQIEESGNEFFAHKTGFTNKSLHQIFASNGFAWRVVGSGRGFQLVGFFFKLEPSAEQCNLAGIEKMHSPNL